MAIRRSTPRTGGRSTPKCIMGYILWDVFGSHLGLQWTPRSQSRDAWNTSTPNLAGEPDFGWWTSSPGNRAENPWIPVSKLGRQTYFGQWTPTPHWIENRCLEYHCSRTWQMIHTLATGAPSKWIKNRCLEYHYTKLCIQTWHWLDGPPSELSNRFTLNTCTSKVVMTWPSLAQWSPQYWHHSGQEWQFSH